MDGARHARALNLHASHGGIWIGRLKSDVPLVLDQINLVSRWATLPWIIAGDSLCPAVRHQAVRIISPRSRNYPLRPMGFLGQDGLLT